ncbi:hypothetical protein [Undibacterium sp. Ji49W]|uniref:hypothetical protein n=1 Tax=Undibacterium sp. Ji49W TaxID=3413040 RepID=UPI003BF095AD
MKLITIAIATAIYFISPAGHASAQQKWKACIERQLKTPRGKLLQKEFGRNDVEQFVLMHCGTAPLKKTKNNKKTLRTKECDEVYRNAKENTCEHPLEMTGASFRFFMTLNGDVFNGDTYLKVCKEMEESGNYDRVKFGKQLCGE